jgi:hypothetical protein
MNTATLGWTQSQSLCTVPITYSLTYANDNNVDSTVFTLGTSYVSVYTTDASKVGVYSLILTGIISTY